MVDLGSLSRGHVCLTNVIIKNYYSESRLLEDLCKGLDRHADGGKKSNMRAYAVYMRLCVHIYLLNEHA